MTEDLSEGPVLVFYTGGTIGCIGRPLVPMGGEAFAAACRRAGLGRGCDWAWSEAALDSSAMTPSDWGDLARMAIERAGPTVILHGTDTLAWSASALALLTTLMDDDGRPVARLGTPVALTGSQRPLFAEREAGLEVDQASDAAGNLDQAVRAAMSGAPGVTVTFGGALLPAARVAKRATLADRAFDAPNGPGAMPALPAPEPGALLAQLDRLGPHLGARAILSLPATPGGAEHETAAAAMDRLGPRLGALHLLGFGLGTLPRETAWAPILAEASARGILVALGSQVLEGPVDPATYGAGAWALEHGAVPTGDMTLPAAQAKIAIGLALASARGWPLETLRHWIATPVAGEITPS